MLFLYLYLICLNIYYVQSFLVTLLSFLEIGKEFEKHASKEYKLNVYIFLSLT